MRGETVSQSVQVYRVKVVICFLRAGVPLSKIDFFRDLLEETGYRLMDRRHLFDYLPFVLKEEENRIKELDGKNISMIFDGTSHLGEALAIVVRFIDEDWLIQQRLIRVQLLAKSLTGEETAREVINVLSGTYSIRPNCLLATMRDRSLVNNVAMRTIQIIYPNLVDIGCFSHTLDLVGQHFNVPNLTEFISFWISLFSHSSKSKLLWKAQTGKAMVE